MRIRRGGIVVDQLRRQCRHRHGGCSRLLLLLLRRSPVCLGSGRHLHALDLLQAERRRRRPQVWKESRRRLHLCLLRLLLRCRLLSGQTDDGAGSFTLRAQRPIGHRAGGGPRTHAREAQTQGGEHGQAGEWLGQQLASGGNLSRRTRAVAISRGREEQWGPHLMPTGPHRRRHTRPTPAARWKGPTTLRAPTGQAAVQGGWPAHLFETFEVSRSSPAKKVARRHRA